MPKALDLTGQKFGKLTALRRLPNQGRRTIWECQCDCGNIIPVRAENLRSGHTTSCGCKKREPSKKFVDLTGQKFGEWTVLSKAEKESYWLCECSCGVKREVYAPSLKSGKSLSCGHLFKNQIRNPIIGSRYGNLIVLEQFKENDTWCCKCQCDCGNTIIVSGNSLQQENTKSCGCIKSLGEQKIAEILRDAKIPFVKEKIFYGTLFRYDFFIQDKYVIEYDGKQHFQDSKWGNEIHTKESQQIRDTEKNNYCFDNNIPIIHIPYTHYQDIELKDLLLETSTFIIHPNNN